MSITKQELKEDRARLGRMVLKLQARVAELEAENVELRDEIDGLHQDAAGENL